MCPDLIYIGIGLYCRGTTSNGARLQSSPILRVMAVLRGRLCSFSVSVQEVRLQDCSLTVPGISFILISVCGHIFSTRKEEEKALSGAITLINVGNSHRVKEFSLPLERCAVGGI